VLICLAAACSLNPVSRRPELVLTSAARERELGAQAAAVVDTQIGLVADAALVDYVRAVGARLALRSPRTDVDYTFHVADMIEPNAFALPAGFVYVSRGLLALLNREDDLAAVLAHEVAHVAARHHQRAAIRRVAFLPLQIAAGLGSALVGVLSPTLGGLVGGVGRLPETVALSAYSREQEREADEVGQDLAAAAGFDPAALASVMDALSREETLNGGDPDRVSFLASHPSTPERSRVIAERARGLQAAAPDRSAATPAEFLRRLDGLLIGPSGAEGAFVGQRFLHVDLDFAVEFPAGWETFNGRDVVVAREPGGKAAAFLREGGEGNDPLTTAWRFARQSSLELVEEPVGAHLGGEPGLPAARALARTGGLGNRSLVELYWIADRGSIWLVGGVAKDASFEERRPVLRAVAESFRPLHPAERSLVREERLRLVETRPSETLAELIACSGSAWSPAQAAIANGIELEGVLAADAPLKLSIAHVYSPGPKP
jgi:predicted Zn-dependent protease